MDTFFPSEIARLVLGYLKEDKCLKSWQTFLEESSNLREYYTLFKTGKVYSTNVNGYSLSDILNEYCVLKFQVKNKDKKTECLSSKSDIIEAFKEDDFIDSTKQTVDCVVQKYLSPSNNLKDNVSTDSSPDVCELPNHNNCGTKEMKKHCTDVAENLSNKSTQDNQRNKKMNTKLDAAKKWNDHFHQIGMTTRSKDFSNRSTSPKSLTSFIQSLSDKLNRKGSPIVKPQNVQNRRDLKENNQSLSNLTPSNEIESRNLQIKQNEENAVSSTEIVLIEGDNDDDDDDDVEIVEEIKKEKSSNNPSSKVKTSCSNNISANQKAVDNIAEENSKVNDSRHEINSLNNSNVEDLQTNNFKDILTKQADVNDQNKINVPECKTDSSNNQVSFVDSGTFLQPSTAVNEMSFSYSQNYILPNYAPSNSFTNSAPVYVVLNTPGASSGPIINGTILTVPPVQTNTVPHPVLPAVSTAFVNNSITAAVNSLSIPLPVTNTVSNVDKIPLPPLKVPHNESLASPPVGLSNSSKKKNSSKTKVDDKILKSSLKTYSKESQLALELFSQVSVGCNDDESSKVSKRKNSPQRRGQKKRMKDSLLPTDQIVPTPEAGNLSFIDYKGEHLNICMSEISSDSCSSKVQKATKRKSSEEKKHKKCKRNKTPDKSPPILKVKIVKPKPKTSGFQSILEEHFPQHDEIGDHLNPSDIITKTSSEVNDGTKSISTLSTSQNNFNNSPLIKSSLPGVEANRVLKVMLSDIFVDIHHKVDSLHDQESDSNTELSMQEKCKNQISDSEKMTVQIEKSPQTTII